MVPGIGGAGMLPGIAGIPPVKVDMPTGMEGIPPVKVDRPTGMVGMLAAGLLLAGLLKRPLLPGTLMLGVVIEVFGGLKLFGGLRLEVLLEGSLGGLPLGSFNFKLLVPIRKLLSGLLLPGKPPLEGGATG
jgi:hypothetical protein